MRSSGLAGVAVVMLLFLSLAGSVEVEIANKTVDVKSLYFPGDEVVVKASFKPNSSFLIDPAGKAYKLEFKGDGENYTARFELKKDVVLGEYQVLQITLLQDSTLTAIPLKPTIKRFGGWRGEVLLCQTRLR